MLLNDPDELVLGPAHHDTARAVDDQHSAARLFTHGFDYPATGPTFTPRSRLEGGGMNQATPQYRERVKA